jgi:hypothetical protein
VYNDIDFGILGYCSKAGHTGCKFRIFEMGSVVIEPNGEYVDGEMYPSDLFEIHVVGTVVTYLQNGVLVYTSLKTPTFPLLAGRHRALQNRLRGEECGNQMHVGRPQRTQNDASAKHKSK